MESYFFPSQLGFSRRSPRILRCLDRKSTRLNSSHLVISYAVFCLKKNEDDLTRTARQRHAAPAQLSAMIRGELDWIFFKTMEKDRPRRYHSANGLAADI